MNKPSLPLTATQKAERLRLQAIDGAKARAEYDAASEQEEQKTVRLRALRLERDRQIAEAADKVAPKGKGASPKPKRAKP